MTTTTQSKDLIEEIMEDICDNLCKYGGRSNQECNNCPLNKLDLHMPDIIKRRERMRRIYISGGISGIPDHREHFMEAQKKLEAMGFSVINPASINAQMPSDTTYEEYMMLAFTFLDMVDHIYMLKGWEKSCGANREYGYARAMDKIIIFESGGGG